MDIILIGKGNIIHKFVMLYHAKNKIKILYKKYSFYKSFD